MVPVQYRSEKVDIPGGPSCCADRRYIVSLMTLLNRIYETGPRARKSTCFEGYRNPDSVFCDKADIAEGPRFTGCIRMHFLTSENLLEYRRRFFFRTEY